MQKNKAEGLTLIELVVVLAILGVLAAIAIPRFSGFRQSAQARICRTNRRTLLRMYHIHREGGEEISLDLYLQGQGVDHCPAGGGISAVNGEIFCDIHPTTSKEDEENDEEDEDDDEDDSGEVPYL